MSVRTAGDSRGFTLPELAVVISLIGLLASLALLNVEQVWTRTRASATVTQLAYMRTALLNLAADSDGLPLTASGGGDPGLTYAPSGLGSSWHGPYMSRWPSSTPFNAGSYRYVGRVGAPAVVQVTGLPDDAAAAVAAQIAAMNGTGASMTAGAGGWTLSLVIGDWYRNSAAPAAASSASAPAAAASPAAAPAPVASAAPAAAAAAPAAAAAAASAKAPKAPKAPKDKAKDPSSPAKAAK
jgi:prepilin-type N-terminal cleavage/methylation domain-containing protein